MSRRSFWRLAASSVMTLAMSTALWSAPPADAGRESARLATFQKPTGETFFALSLVPRIAVKTAATTDVVVLFDTSASQSGMYRDSAMTALHSVLESLGPDDRVKLIAVDVNAQPLTGAFVKADSPEMQAALAKLSERLPLGSTDMGAALGAAVQSFSKEPTGHRAVLYLGDGISRSNLLDGKEFTGLIGDLVQRRAAVSSLAVGPKHNVPLLAAVANQTGGVVAIDRSLTPESEASPQELGSALARAVRMPVIWPTKSTVSDGIADCLPKVIPPLRTDRDTVLVGTLQGDEAQEVSLTAEVAGKLVDLKWNVAAEKSSEEFSFLPALVELGRPADGVALPTVGSDGLREAGRVLQNRAEELARLGQQALTRGDTAGARQVADVAARIDQGNPLARAILAAAQNPPAADAPKAGDDDGLRLGNKPAGAGAEPGGLLREFEAGGDFLGNVETQKALLAQKIQADVERTLSESRLRMRDDAEGATLALKLLLEDVERAADVDAEIRAQLRNKIEGTIREAGRQAAIFADQKAKESANRASALEAQKVVEATDRKQERVKQLMDRFSSLMEEGRYREAENDIAMQVREIEPENLAAMAGAFTSRFSFHLHESERLFELRHANFTNALYQVELSHVPFNEEPPIVYPAPEVWEALTRRREKYKSVDLARTGGAEEKDSPGTPEAD